MHRQPFIADGRRAHHRAVTPVTSHVQSTMKVQEVRLSSSRAELDGIFGLPQALTLYVSTRKERQVPECLLSDAALD